MSSATAAFASARTPWAAPSPSAGPLPIPTESSTSCASAHRSGKTPTPRLRSELSARWASHSSSATASPALCARSTADTERSLACSAAVAPRWPIPVARQASLHTWPAYITALEDQIINCPWNDLFDTLAAKRVPVHLIKGDSDTIGDVELAEIAGRVLLGSIGNRAGLGHVHPHMLRAAFVMAALDAVRSSGEAPHGTSSLPADLSDDQLDAAPVLGSIDTLLIHQLSEDEDDAFAAALEA